MIGSVMSPLRGRVEETDGGGESEFWPDFLLTYWPKSAEIKLKFRE
jgi:hypothetical protein